MAAPGSLDEWAREVLRQGIGIGAVFRDCFNRGVPPERARDLAEESVQQALSRAAEIPDLVGRFQNNFEHFCNWVRRVAINAARGVLRREWRQRQLEVDDLEMTTAEAPAHVQAVQEFLEQLTDDDRQVLMLPYEENWTLDELARRFLPPDDRTENARRLAICRRQRDIQQRFRQWFETG
jgi:RNA polymerase sigma factor (sigma-70 family)